MPEKSYPEKDPKELRQQAERVLKREKPCSQSAQQNSEMQRLLHELEVHQVELEMQNAELQQVRDSMAVMLEKYMNLYDFAPVGYLTLDASGKILDINLTGANLFENERPQMTGRHFEEFVASSSITVYKHFLSDVFLISGKHAIELPVLTETGEMRWMDAQAICLPSSEERQQLCRLALSDITPLKRAAAAKKRMSTLIRVNRELEEEIEQRRSAEKALRTSQHRQSLLLKESQHMQKQLRQLSHGILEAQEAERRRVSVELHDEITQTLIGINMELGGLLNELASDDYSREKITQIKELVEQSVTGIHRFAMELRPTLLDDLGLVPALKGYIEEFSKRTNLKITLSAYPEVEDLSNSYRTVLFRVTQSALANIIQHAEASKVQIKIQQFKERLRLDIHDNGKSFDVQAVLKANKHKRMGLIGMRERVEIVGGAFQILSSPQSGTTVSVTLPTSPGPEPFKKV